MFETLEEAQAEILRLTDELNDRTTERDNLAQTQAELNTELERVRNLNQRYFERLIAQDTKAGEDEKDEPVPSCEEFAKTIKI